VRLERIRIRDFRNIPAAEIVFRSRRVVVLGDNGQGKTNLLEALHLLCLTRAFRTTRMRQLLRQPRDPVGGAPEAFLVEGDFATSRRGLRQARAQFRDGVLVFELDGNRCRGRDYFGQLPLVLLSPESLDVSQGGPEARRRTLDRLMSAASPLYLDQLLRYQRALRQRSALLIQQGPQDDGAAVWEEGLARHGLELTRRRRSFVDGLAARVAEIHRRHFHPQGAFGLGYEASLDEGLDAAAAQAAWAADREGDARRGWTRRGPHRDELPVLLDGLPLRHFGSQGQHKLFMLCLTLAETELLKEMTGEAPLLLLDDLFGLLDDDKIRALAEAVDAEVQVIISTTSLRHVDLLARGAGDGAQVLHCAGGTFRGEA
jgi:DNA replication and repair protein RecF